MSFLGIGTRTLFALAFALTPAFANTLSATGSVTCTGYTLDMPVSGLNTNPIYRLDYTVTLTPSAGSPITDSGSITKPFTGFSTFDFTVTKLLAVPAGTYTVTGTATLYEDNLFDNLASIVFTSTTLSCGGGGGGGGGGGCPATIGFWKHHAFPNAVKTSGLTIGGVTYTAANLLTILNGNGGNAVVILGRQLVGALLNQAAGGAHNATADAAISTAGALLLANSLNLLTSNVAPTSTLGQALTTQAAILDAYNNANFSTCSEGSGLILGTN